MNQVTTSTQEPAAPTAPSGGQLVPAPAAEPANGRGGRAVAPGAVRISRVVVRRIDPWTVLKVSILFYLCVCIVLLTAGTLLWAGANSLGVVENIEGFLDEVGFSDFRFRPGQILRGSALGGLVLVVAGSLANVLMAVLYNLINDVVGGIKLTLGEDDTAKTRR